MDIKTLEIIYEKLDKIVDYLEEHEPNSKSLTGLEVATQLIFDMYFDEMYNNNREELFKKM